MEALRFLLTIGWPAAICLILGLGLIVFEMFTPRFGAPGVIGLILLVIGIVLAVNSVTEALIMLLLLLVILSLTMFFAIRAASKGALAHSPSALHPPESEYLSVNDMDYFVGREGVALTALGPSGMGDFDGVRLDIVTEGEHLAKDTPITVVKVEGQRIVVRQAEPHA